MNQTRKRECNDVPVYSEVILSTGRNQDHLLDFLELEFASTFVELSSLLGLKLAMARAVKNSTRQPKITRNADCHRSWKTQISGKPAPLFTSETFSQGGDHLAISFNLV
jgi:hypothetical protein